MTMPKVSVIIPCYNLGQYIDEAVSSVLAQTFQDFEIIIVNDGSTDELTNTVLSDYRKPKTTVLTTANQGLPSARNTGIDASSGEYVCCLDADDKYHPEFLEKCVTVLEEDKEHAVGFVTTYVQQFGNTDALWECEEYNPYRLVVVNLIGVASLFRRTCWKEVGGYATNLSGFHDWNFWISIVAKGYRWVTIKEPLFYYRDREHSMLKSSSKKKLELHSIIHQNNIVFLQEHLLAILHEYNKELCTFDAYYAESQQLSRAHEQILNSLAHEQILNSLAYRFGTIFADTKRHWKYMLLLFPRLVWFFIPGGLKKRINSLHSTIDSFFYQLHSKPIMNPTWPKNTPLVSVIISCHNDGDYLEEAIDSVLQQTFQNFEILLLFDAKTLAKETVEKLNAITATDNRTHLRSDGPVPDGERGYGLEEAQGRYICYLEADDKFKPTYLEKCLIKMEYEQLDLCVSHVEVMNENGEHYTTKPFLFQNGISENSAIVPAVFKKESLKNIYDKDETLVKDAHNNIFWETLLKSTWRTGEICEPLLLHRTCSGDVERREAEPSIPADEERLWKLFERQNPIHIVENKNINLIKSDSMEGKC